MEQSYRYDGTFMGFLCCVFESYAAKEIPQNIISEGANQHSLFEGKPIITEEKKAHRVLRSIEPSMGGDAYDFILRSFLTCLPDRELHMLLFLRAGYRHGPAVMNRLADPELHPLFRAVRYLENEVHLYTGFVRFSVYEDRMYAQIKPKNRVLPLLRPHFCQRFPGESLLIYDKTHREALLYEEGEHILMHLPDWHMPEPDAEEKAYRAMWKHFYQNIAIESRINPKLRRNHMPKRYWPDMTEFRPD